MAGVCYRNGAPVGRRAKDWGFGGAKPQPETGEAGQAPARRSRVEQPKVSPAPPAGGSPETDPRHRGRKERKTSHSTMGLHCNGLGARSRRQLDTPAGWISRPRPPCRATPRRAAQNAHSCARACAPRRRRGPAAGWLLSQRGRRVAVFKSSRLGKSDRPAAVALGVAGDSELGGSEGSPVSSTSHSHAAAAHRGCRWTEPVRFRVRTKRSHRGHAARRRLGSLTRGVSRSFDTPTYGRPRGRRARANVGVNLWKVSKKCQGTRASATPEG